MKIKLKKENINLYQMTNLSFDKKFEIFYTFRFNEDYLKNDLNNKKISKKKSKYWFQNCLILNFHKVHFLKKKCRFISINCCFSCY